MQNGIPVVKIKLGEKIGTWRVVMEIGRGTYGVVYRVIDDAQKREAAMKIENRNLPSQYRTLKVELNVMRELRNKNCKNCVQFITAGQTPSFNYIVMNLVGPNLETVAKKLAKAPNKPGVFTPYTVFYTALQTMESIEDLHKKLFLHRDIKPQNFAIGCNSTDYKCIYLMDFGTTRRYAKENGSHHRPRAKVAFRGSTLYASVGALMQVDQGRRDDVWSWLFMMIRLTVGQLPWSHMEFRRVTNYEGHLEAYAEVKKNFIDNPQALLKGCPPEFIPIWKSLQHLLFHSRPDYKLITEKLNEGLNRCAKESPGTVLLDWERPASPDLTREQKSPSHGPVRSPAVPQRDKKKDHKKPVQKLKTIPTISKTKSKQKQGSLYSLSSIFASISRFFRRLNPRRFIR